MSKRLRRKKYKPKNYLNIGDTIYHIAPNKTNDEYPDILKNRNILRIIKTSDDYICLEVGPGKKIADINWYSRTLNGPPLTNKDFK
jgi:hypothetical protein